MRRLRRIRITRTRPAHAAAASSAASALATFSEGVRRLVLADLQEGVVRIGDLPRLIRALTWLGFVLLFAMVGVLFFSEAFRAAFPLLSTISWITPRGALIPSALIPLTLFIFSVAWAFLLVGALHARLAVRLAVLLLYLVVAGVWIISISSIWFSEALIWVTLLLVPIFFFVRRRAQAAPALEFGVLVVLVCLTFGLPQIYAIEMLDIMLSGLVDTLSFLILPLVLFIGLDIAEFVHRAASWVSGLTDSWTNRRVLYGVLFLLLIWRFGSVVLQALDRVERSSPAEEAASYAGGLVIPLAVGLVGWLVWRQGGEDVSVERLMKVAKKVALPLIAAYLGLQILNSVLFMLGGSLSSVLYELGFRFQERGALTKGALEFTDRLSAQYGTWEMLLAVVAILASFWLARQGRRTVALYLGILGTNMLWMELTEAGRPLSFFGWNGFGPVDFWWVVAFGAVTFVWLVQGRLTEGRARRLLLLVMITFLMSQTEFIEDPFSPFLGFTGLGLVALGIIWDSLTIGFWANNGSRGLPRVSRIFMYLGYVLLGVAVLNWYVASHNILEVDFFTGLAALAGFSLFGKPLIYAIFVVTLAQAATSRKHGEPVPKDLEKRNVS